MRNNVESPYEVWKNLAACYLEMGNIPKADHWLKKVLDADRKEPDQKYWDWMTYIPYFLETNRPARALELLLTIKQANELYQYDFYLTLGRTYRMLGEDEKALKYLRLQVSTFKLETKGYAALALAVYEIENDVALAETYYLKSIELAGDQPILQGLGYGNVLFLGSY